MQSRPDKSVNRIWAWK